MKKPKPAKNGLGPKITKHFGVEAMKSEAEIMEILQKQEKFFQELRDPHSRIRKDLLAAEGWLELRGIGQ